MPGIVEALRAEHSRVGASGAFEIIVALTGAPDLDAFRRAEDAGATALVNFPLGYALGPGSSLEAKRAALEQYAEAFIVPSR